MSNELRAELDEWIDENWDPELPVENGCNYLLSLGLQIQVYLSLMARVGVDQKPASWQQL